MSGEKDLDTLLRTLSARLVPGVHVFVTLPDDQVPDGICPRMMFREAEGTTLILLQSEAVALGLPHTFPCRMITLDVHSSLEAVGFIARIGTAFAAHGLGINPVAGFHHDHLFVANGREGDALRILEQIARDARGDR